MRFTGGWCAGAALLLVLLAAGAARGQGTPDTVTVPAEECCGELLSPLGARPVALGRAVVADTAPDMIAYNPAGIAGLRRPQLEVHYRKLPLDVQLLGLAYVSRAYSVGSFAVSYTLFDRGTFPITDTAGNQTGSTFSAVHVLAATFAARVGQGVSAGLTYKLFVMQTPCNNCDTGGASGATQLVDAGIQYHPRRLRWAALGAAVTNAGIPLQVVNFEQSDQPPTRLRFGGTYEVLHLFQRDTTLTGSVSAQMEMLGPPGPVPALGAQVSVGGVVAMRLGWRSEGRATNTLGGDLDAGVALGVGIHLGRYTLDVARAVNSATLDASPFHVTFGMSF